MYPQYNIPPEGLTPVRPPVPRRRGRPIQAIVLAVLLMLAVVAALCLKRGEVNGVSMEPTFYSGDSVLIWKTFPMSRLQPGDIVVFKLGKQQLIKRVAFITPRPVTQAPDGYWIAVTGTRYKFSDLFETYFFDLSKDPALLPPPDHTIYVLGDNLDRSSDSRDFGPISPGQIIGKVLGKH